MIVRTSLALQLQRLTEALEFLLKLQVRVLSHELLGRLGASPLAKYLLVRCS
jgi:hypothetical protein